MGAYLAAAVCSQMAVEMPGLGSAAEEAQRVVVALGQGCTYWPLLGVLGLLAPLQTLDPPQKPMDSPVKRVVRGEGLKGRG